MAFPQPVTGGEDGGSSSSGGEKQHVDPILNNFFTANIIKQDLILLENQIPYFVLEQLFKLTVALIPDGNKKLSLEEYVLLYFSEVENCGSKTKTCSCFPKDCVLWVSGQSKEIEPETERLKDDKRKDYFHILHLLQDRLEDGYFPGDLGENFKRINSTKFSEFKVSAADLHNAGVEFLSHPSRVYVTEGISWRFNGIRFYILGLVIHERTEVFLRNLIALEQCNDPNIQRKFTSYAKVMSMLINSEKDVQVFKDAGIIHNYLGTDKDVPDLFDKLCEGVTVQGDLYLDAWQVAIEYYKRRFFLPRNTRYWTRLIFTSTWGVVAFALGIITSLITVAQFVRDFRK